MEQYGSDFVSYSSDSDGTFWEKQTMTLDEFAAMGGDIEQSMQMFIDCADSFEKVGKDQVNGSEATRYDGAISGESVETAIRSGLTMSALSEGLDLDMEEQSYSDLGSIPCSLWIDSKSGIICYTT